MYERYLCVRPVSAVPAAVVSVINQPVMETFSSSSRQPTRHTGEDEAEPPPYGTSLVLSYKFHSSYNASGMLYTMTGFTGNSQILCCLDFLAVYRKSIISVSNLIDQMTINTK